MNPLPLIELDSEPSPGTIVVSDLTKCYAHFAAVNALSFTVRKGEIFGLLGVNGAGKSTLMRMLSTLIPPTSGCAFVSGFDVVRQPEAVRRAIGVIPQAMTSDLDLTVEENLSIYAKLYNMKRIDRRERIEELLETIRLAEWRTALTRTLSGGMRRRLEIARALLHRPDICFLDEPTTGLDPNSRLEVWELLKRLRASQNMTMLLTTHYMEEADYLCDRIAIVDAGTLVALDSPSVLKASVSTAQSLELIMAQDASRLAAILQYAYGDLCEISCTHNLIRVVTSNCYYLLPLIIRSVEENAFRLVSLSMQSTSLNDVFRFYTERSSSARKSCI